VNEVAQEEESYTHIPIYMTRGELANISIFQHNLNFHGISAKAVINVTGLDKIGMSRQVVRMLR
jgi:hypothetical protein